MDSNNSNQSPTVPDNTSSKYQDILDQYSKQITMAPDEETDPEAEKVTSTDDILRSIPTEPVLTPPPPAIVPPPDPVSSTPPLPLSIPMPALSPAPVVTQPQIAPIPPVVTPVKGSNFFKILFFISLLIFLTVASALAISFISGSKNEAGPANPVPTITEPTNTPEADSFCYLNDNKYKLNDTFPSADGCNTCTCGVDGTIACTEKACAE